MTEVIKDVECLGGPNDGKVVQVSSAEGEHCCMVAVSSDGTSHWYVVLPHEGKDTFMHAGTDPWNIVEMLREHNPLVAAELASQMRATNEQAFEDEDDDADEGCDFDGP
jgi:hypothetical protein